MDFRAFYGGLGLDALVCSRSIAACTVTLPRADDPQEVADDTDPV